MKAREFLARTTGEPPLRHIVKEPLTAPELERLAERLGGAEHLVAPKRRKEAAGLTGKALITWLAADGGNVRRPIIVRGRSIYVGFDKATQAKLADDLAKAR